MIEYFAFLRGINVGGKNSIKMESLRAVFEECGFQDVKTYIQSGNVIFKTRISSNSALSRKIEDGLKKSLNMDIPVIVRSKEEMAFLVKKDPFKKINSPVNAKNYIVFMEKNPNIELTLPIYSEKDGVQLIDIIDDNAFLLSLEIRDGRFGVPNLFIEKKFKIKATSRYWHILQQMLEIEK